MTLSLGSILDALLLWPLPPQGAEQSEAVDPLYLFIYWLTFIVFWGVIFVMAYFCWRYRRRPGVGPEKSPNHHTALEVTWSVIPLLFVIVIFWWGYRGFLDLAVAPPNAYKIEVTAWQWGWKFRYPNGAETLFNQDGLHVPPGEPVQLVMTSNDVLHSFYVRDFRVKQDVVPGRYTTLWFNAIPGLYKGFCTEYCGTAHSNMNFEVTVHESRAAFDEWLAGRPTGEMDGETVYKSFCQACHTTTADRGVGPGFGGLFGKQETVTRGPTGPEETVTVDEAYLKESILVPEARVVKGFPNAMIGQDFGSRLKPVEIDNVIEFIKKQK